MDFMDYFFSHIIDGALFFIAENGNIESFEKPQFQNFL